MNPSSDTVEVALVHHREGRLSEAESAYRLALTQFPHLPELHYNLGTIYQAQGKLTEAEFLYRQSIALRPDFPDPYNNLGNILKEKGDLMKPRSPSKKLCCFARVSPKPLATSGVSLNNVAKSNRP